MTEAFNEVIRFLFEEVKINRIAACHDSKNPASGKIMKKCGLKYEGLFRQAGVTSEGIYSDLMCYSILKEEWGK